MTEEQQERITTLSQAIWHEIHLYILAQGKSDDTLNEVMMAIGLQHVLLLGVDK